MTLGELIKLFDKLWPLATAEEWDRPGLMVGNPSQSVSKVMLSVDVTGGVIAEALESGCQLLLTHHPLLLRGVHELGELTLKGNLVSKAIRGNLAIYSAHTNADIAPGGVSESLAYALGLSNLSKLDSDSGHGIVGSIKPTKLLEFARQVAKTLPAVAAGIKVAGHPEKLISSVSLVAGAGDGFLAKALSSGADLFITSDLRHHPAQDFVEQSQLVGGPALMDISHWAAEWVWLEGAANQLRSVANGVEFVVSDLRTDPWDFAVMQ